MAAYGKIFTPRPYHQTVPGGQPDKALVKIVEAVIHQLPSDERPTFREVMLKNKTVDLLTATQKANLKAMVEKLPAFSKALLTARVGGSLNL